MEKPKIIRHTGEFQSMIDKYRKSTNKILVKSRLCNSLNSYFLKEITQVKSKENFSDVDYFINEIKFANKIKGKIKENRLNKDKVPKILNDKSYTEKLAKDIFFYYKNQFNGKNKKINENKNMNFKNKERIKSPKSIHTINSAKKSNFSNRRPSQATIILPLIYSNDKYLTPCKKNCKTIANEDDEKSGNFKSENGGRIIFSGRKRMERYLNFERNYFNKINEEMILKYMKRVPKKLLWKIKLPLVSNKIFNKVEEANDISKSISRNINHISNEGNTAIDREKKRIKFMNNLMY